jgi:hypothetical protein
MAFTLNDGKKKRGFLLVADEGDGGKGGDSKMREGDEASADEPEVEDDGDFEALAEKAGVTDLEAFMAFLKAALARCK